MSKSRRVGGGKDQFKWDDVAKDPQRGNYLGNSLFTSQQRSFSNPNPRELDFYLKDTTKKDHSTDIKEEMDAIKAQEAEMMAALLGLPTPALSASSSASHDTSSTPKHREDSKQKSRDHKHKHKHKHKKRDRSPSPTRRSRDERSRPSEGGLPPLRGRELSPKRERDGKRRRSPSPDSLRFSEPSKRSKYEE
jgi:hypothetical protein